MCQPFSFKAVVTAPRSPCGVAGNRSAGAVLPTWCSCTGRPPNSRGHGTAGFGSDGFCAREVRNM